MGNKFIFLSIPKTGTSTLNAIIRKNYDKNQIFNINGYMIDDSIKKFKNLPSNKINKYKWITGHMGFGLHRLLKGNVKYITILRDPIDRVISYYYYLQQASFYGKTYKKAKNMTLEEYIETKESFGLSNEHGLNNEQTRFLSSTNGFPITFKDKLKLDENDLKRAKNNLKKHFALIGITKKYD